MTYREYITKRDEVSNSIPFGFAFSNEQFEKMLNKWNLDASNPDDLATIVSIGGGAYIQKKDIDEMHKSLEELDTQFTELMKDDKFLFDAFVYEMENHEFEINMQKHYDVLTCLGFKCNGEDTNPYAYEYIENYNLTPHQLEIYEKAMKEYYRLAEENEWF